LVAAKKSIKIHGKFTKIHKCFTNFIQNSLTLIKNSLKKILIIGLKTYHQCAGFELKKQLIYKNNKY
jgi:hypothetical protein